MSSISAVMFREYAAEAAAGTVAGRFGAPITVIPFSVTICSPGTASHGTT